MTVMESMLLIVKEGKRRERKNIRRKWRKNLIILI